ncbi:hypothetical protein EMIT053CA3_30291 [Pseudomonas donghuensis]
MGAAPYRIETERGIYISSYRFYRH